MANEIIKTFKHKPVILFEIQINFLLNMKDWHQHLLIYPLSELLIFEVNICKCASWVHFLQEGFILINQLNWTKLGNYIKSLQANSSINLQQFNKSVLCAQVMNFIWLNFIFTEYWTAEHRVWLGGGYRNWLLHHLEIGSSKYSKAGETQ